MEECMVCLEEKKSDQFIIFSCKHKTCNDCFPLLLLFSTPCPICEQPIILYQKQSKQPKHCIEYCKILTGISMMSVLCFYIVNYAFQKN